MNGVAEFFRQDLQDGYSWIPVLGIFREAGRRRFARTAVAGNFLLSSFQIFAFAAKNHPPEMLRLRPDCSTVLPSSFA